MSVETPDPARQRRRPAPALVALAVLGPVGGLLVVASVGRQRPVADEDLVSQLADAPSSAVERRSRGQAGDSFHGAEARVEARAAAITVLRPSLADADVRRIMDESDLVVASLQAQGVEDIPMFIRRRSESPHG